jgi:hypothetical protein
MGFELMNDTGKLVESDQGESGGDKADEKPKKERMIVFGNSEKKRNNFAGTWSHRFNY